MSEISVRLRRVAERLASKEPMTQKDCEVLMDVVGKAERDVMKVKRDLLRYTVDFEEDPGVGKVLTDLRGAFNELVTGLGLVVDAMDDRRVGISDEGKGLTGSAPRKAGTMAEFEVRAVRHPGKPEDSVETMLVINGNDVVVSSEEPLSSNDLYERCFKAVSREIDRHARRGRT